METLQFLGLAVLIWFVFIALRNVERSQSALQEQLFALSRHLGLMSEAGTEPSEKVRELAAESKTYVAAIRTYREETGSGLKLARAIVDSLPKRKDA